MVQLFVAVSSGLVLVLAFAVARGIPQMPMPMGFDELPTMFDDDLLGPICVKCLGGRSGEILEQSRCQ